MNPKDIKIFYALDDTESAILTIYGEARGETFEGKQAVALVIANRAEQWGKTIRGVCYAKNQFSCYSSKDKNYPLLLSIAEDFDSAMQTNKALQECSQAWHDETKEVEVLIDGATFYKVKGAHNPWFDRQIDKGVLVKVAEIEHHEFYKEV